MSFHRRVSTFILIIYVLSIVMPLPACAADAGGGGTAAAAAALGVAMPGQGTGTGAEGGIDLSEGTGGDGADAADTGQGGEEAAFPDISDQATTEPDTVVVNDKRAEDDKHIGTTSAPDATVATSSRLDPREVRGSSMFNNLRGRLRRFGSDFFANRRANSLTYAPVGPSYVIAPGDEVRLNVWGYNELRANLVVDRDGTLTLPQAGPVQAAGLTFAELQQEVKAAYGTILNDFELNISMGKLHTITVYVTGSAARPGAYAVSSMATLVDVLSQAGGPSIAGSMRNIEIKRGHKKIATFDVYSLLLRGDRKGDVRLAEGDVIFIPTVGPLVSVAGNVKRPAVYEMSQKETKLKDVINLAGGLTSGAYKGRIQIVRVHDNQFRTAFESNLEAPNTPSQKLRDGDLLKIFAVPGGAFNVRIAGAVIQPGMYAIEPGVTTLADIINRAGGLLYTAADKGELTRVEVSPNGPVTTRNMYNLKDVMQSRILLQRDDYFFVRAVPDWDIYRSASINGRVLYPGSYAVKRGERLSSLLDRAGGYASGAFTKGAVFIRDSIRRDQQKNIDEMVKTLEREVMASGNEAASTAITNQDVQFAQASMKQKEKYLDTMKNLKASGRLVIALPDDPKLLRGSAYDIELQEGDRLFLPERPGTVQVIGSVVTQSAFVFRPGLPFSEYIKMAGGYSKTASKKRTYIMKADGSTVRAFVGNKPRTIEEGDFIVVPEKVVFVPAMRNTLNVIDILYKLVLGVAAIDYVFR